MGGGSLIQRNKFLTDAGDLLKAGGGVGPKLWRITTFSNG